MIPNCSQNLANDSALKEAMLSVTIFLGQPNLVMRSSRNPMITLWEELLVEIASIHLVKKSVAVRIHLLIQVDIGGHTHIPLGPPPLLLSVFQFPHSLLFLAIFRVLNFWSHFEALNNVFCENGEQHVS